MISPDNSQAQTKIPQQTTGNNTGLAVYLKGFALALLLTLMAFALVALGSLPKTLVLPLIFALALLQILVHLHYFLHLGLSPENQPYLLTIAFTFLIIAIMVGGTLWILYDLRLHTMMTG